VHSFYYKFVFVKKKNPLVEYFINLVIYNGRYKKMYKENKKKCFFNHIYIYIYIYIYNVCNTC